MKIVKDYFPITVTVVGILYTYYWSHHLSLGGFFAILLIGGLALSSCFAVSIKRLKVISISLSAALFLFPIGYVGLIFYALNHMTTPK